MGGPGPFARMIPRGAGSAPPPPAFPPAEWSDGRDGDIVINDAGFLSLTQDLHCNNLTIIGSGVLVTANYKIFARGIVDVSQVTSGGIFSQGQPGSPGSANAGAVPGLGGAGLLIFSPGSVGKRAVAGIGGNGGAGGAAGLPGQSASEVYGARSGGSSSNGGAGGAAGGGGAGGAAGLGSSLVIIDAIAGISDSKLGTWGNVIADILWSIEGYPNYKSVFLAGTDYNATVFTTYRVRQVSGTGAFEWTFGLPRDFRFVNLGAGNGVHVCGIPSAGAAGAGRTATLTLQGGRAGGVGGDIGDLVTQGSLTQGFIVDLTGQTDREVRIWNIAGMVSTVTNVLTNQGRGSVLSLQVDHVAMQGLVNYTGILLEYCSRPDGSINGAGGGGGGGGSTAGVGGAGGGEGGGEGGHIVVVANEIVTGAGDWCYANGGAGGAGGTNTGVGGGGGGGAGGGGGVVVLAARTYTGAGTVNVSGGAGGAGGGSAGGTPGAAGADGPAGLLVTYRI